MPVSKHPIPTCTPNLHAGRLQALQALFPEAFSEGQVDFERLRQALGDLADERPERYAFTWAGKRDALRLLQTPTRATLLPCRGESLDFETTRNLFIESDNLEALKLLYKSYFGRVKLIYIDPPYNTGSDFVYPDNFADPLSTYLQLTGQQDAAGNLLTSNPESSGRYHSAWLSMIYPRLFLARQLLREDGVIFVSIDDHEVHNLRMVMNEIFGEENFLGQLIWKSRQFPDSRAVTQISTDHEYVLVYSRQNGTTFKGVERDETKFSNPDKDLRGDWMSRSILGLATKEQRPNLHYDLIDPNTGIVYKPPENTGWRYSQVRMKSLISDNCIIFPASPNGRPREKKFRNDLINEFISFPTIIDDVFTASGTAEIRSIFGFDAMNFPKPSALIKKLLEQTTNSESIVLDFFAGSSTTAQAVLELNREDDGDRRFILVQLPEPTSNAQFATIAEIGKERIRRVVARMKQERAGQLPLETRSTPEDLGFRVYKLAASNFQPWAGAPKAELAAFTGQMALFHDPLVQGWTDEGVLAELILKHGLDLCSRVEALALEEAGEKVYRVTDAERRQKLVVSLAQQIQAEIALALDLGHEDVFICRDAALDDATAANLALQCRLETI